MRFPNGHFVFLDLETTGGKASGDHITEVGLIEVLDGEVIDQYSTLVNPGVHISSFITSLTGIDDAMVAKAPAFADIAEDLLMRLHDRILVAHNARFDLSFLKNEFRRLGYDYRTKVLCTVKLSRALMPQLSSHGLDNLIHVHGLHVESRHRAMGDADLLVQLMCKWVKLYDIDTVSHTINQQLRRPSLPPHLPASDIDRLPNHPGVYLFYDQRDALLYVGKSVKIRDRVRSHFSADHASDKELELSRQVHRIDFQETAGDLGAQLLEAKLIKEHQPIYNRQLRRTKKLWYIELVEDKAGYLLTRIKNDKALPLDKLDKIVGLFRSKKMAEETLRAASDTENLCHRLTQLEKVKTGPCFSHQLRRCQGACVGKETPEVYNQRVLSALETWRFKVWPYAGPVILCEQRDQLTLYHLVNQWCYLGSADSPEALQQDKNASATASPGEALAACFEYDTYKILLKFLAGREKSTSQTTMILCD